MRRSKVEIYLHYVWTTARREPLLTPEVKAAAYRLIGSEAVKMGCDVLRIGGIEDHVHTLLKVPATVAPAALAKQMKGVSAPALRDGVMHCEPFHWQQGYGVYSVSRSHVAQVKAYIDNQEEHHRTGDIWPALEETDEEVPENEA